MLRQSALLHSLLVFQAPRQVRLTTKLNNVAAMEGKDAIFKCAVTPADASVRWFHKGLPIAAGIKYKAEQSGNCHTLTITSVSQQDAGEISFEAEGKSCKANLQVQRKSIGVISVYLWLHNDTTYSIITVFFSPLTIR